MTELTCPTCGATNAAESRFCAKCGTALPIASAHSPAAPTGWDLATAAMSQPTAAPTTDTRFAPDDYASWGARFGGSLLDNLILFAIFAVVGGVVAGVIYASDPEALSRAFDDVDSNNGSSTSFFASFSIWAVLAAMGSFVWDILWIRSRSMGKPGQKVAGFRVTTRDGQRVSTKQAAGRAAAKLLYNIPQVGWLGTITTAITIGASQRHQALHDMMSSTVCVELDALTARGLGPRAANLGQGLGPSTTSVITQASPQFSAAPPYTPPPTAPPNQSGPFI